MDYLTFPAAFTALLKHHTPAASAAEILTAMEAPYLFLHRDGRYTAGTGFFAPQWMHMYLRPLGLQLTKHTLERTALSSFLKSSTPAMLKLAENRYLFVSLRSGQRVCLGDKYTTLPTLLKHSPEQLSAYTLDTRTPEATDFLALMAESAQTLKEYADDLAGLLNRTVNRVEIRDLHTRYFRSLMVDIPRVAHHYEDEMLQEELRLLHHAYQHLFVIGEEEADLQERLSRKRILSCISWLRENIIDRMYALGASDMLIEQCSTCHTE